MENDLSSYDKKIKYTSSIATLFAVVLVVLIALLLFFQYKNSATTFNSQIQHELDSVKGINDRLLTHISELKLSNKAAQTAIKEHFFDAFDENNYRVYGLYKDLSNEYTAETIAETFNIYNKGAIKFSKVLGFNWYIIPVKGVHHVKEEETLTDVAAIYYQKASDSILIKKFNPKIKSGRHIFIPFNK